MCLPATIDTPGTGGYGAMQKSKPADARAIYERFGTPENIEGGKKAAPQPAPKPAAPAAPAAPAPKPAAQLQTPTTVKQQRPATGSRTRRLTQKKNLNTGLSIGEASNGGLNV